ncbi:MAG: Phosphotransferase enzyme family protein [Firmicutes bacterium ADurb.Bin153]|nr:MAG: Phosphotransferase enzyme family protein [Firmicutes bacterium ADurb.Bin153]HPU95605.1 hypothetical protein [Bacillota bacterium]
MTGPRPAEARRKALAGSAAKDCAAAVREDIDVEAALGRIPGFIRLDKLESSKGRCYRLDLSGVGPLFVKVFEDEGKAANEASVSSRLAGSGISCPAPFAVEGPVLVRAYLDASTATEELEAALKWGDVSSAARLCAKVAGLLADVHALDSESGRGIVVNDLNLRNFLVAPNCGLSIIDLAEAGFGEQAKDLGALAVHILTHKPEFTDVSTMMADDALYSYFERAGTLWDASNILWGFGEALKDASARRKRPELPELAAGYMSHLRTRTEAMRRRAHHGAQD